MIEMMIKKLSLALLFTLALAAGYAAHIIGGEITYTCQGNNQYQIQLKIYRDCFSGGAAFDNPGTLYIFLANGQLYKSLDATPIITNIPANVSNPCMVSPPTVCVEEGVYTFLTTLPPTTGGYNLVYQRCCRNNTIVNLDLPGFQGASYIAHIPEFTIAACNNSPYFNNFPPIVICANDPLHFDHSATDPDGDSLVYSLCAPFLGASQAMPLPSPANPPPYSTVIYSSGYTAKNPLSANPKIAIDPQTGMLTGKPNVLGQFVVGVCVKEYRNGVLLDVHRREFQFNITNCSPIVVAAIPTLNANPDTMSYCEGFTVDFGNNSIGANTFHWDFGVSGMQSDTSNVMYPSFTYNDTGTYTIFLVANPGTLCSDTDTVILRLYPFFTADFTHVSACPYEPVIFSDKSLSQYGSVIDWLWQFGNGMTDTLPNPYLIYGISGSYQVDLQIINSLGCVAQTTQTIEVYPKPIANFNSGTPCIGSPISFTDFSTVSSGSITNWLWDFGDGSASETTKNPYHTYTIPDIYTTTLIVMTNHGCVDTIIKTINILDPPAASISADTSICLGDFANLEASGGLYYNWNPSDGILRPNTPNPRAAPLTTTTYTVNVSDDCFFDTAEVTIQVLPLPVINAGKDTAIYHGTSAFLHASGTGISYEWNPKPTLSDPFNLNTDAMPQTKTTYTISATGSNGCVASDEVKVILLPVCDRLYIPNAFSPNNDGNNDVFQIIDYGQNVLLHLKIFNRWGKKIFETDNLADGWDGNYLGIPQEVGVYVYQINLRCGHEYVSKQGNLTLFR